MFSLFVVIWFGKRRISPSRTPRSEMKVDYLKVCSRASDNTAFIWICGFRALLADCSEASKLARCIEAASRRRAPSPRTYARNFFRRLARLQKFVPLFRDGFFLPCARTHVLTTPLGERVPVQWWVAGAVLSFPPHFSPF